MLLWKIYNNDASYVRKSRGIKLSQYINYIFEKIWLMLLLQIYFAFGKFTFIVAYIFWHWNEWISQVLAKIVVLRAYLTDAKESQTKNSQITTGENFRQQQQLPLFPTPRWVKEQRKFIYLALCGKQSKRKTIPKIPKDKYQTKGKRRHDHSQEGMAVQRL